MTCRGQTGFSVTTVADQANPVMPVRTWTIIGRKETAIFRHELFIGSQIGNSIL